MDLSTALMVIDHLVLTVGVIASLALHLGRAFRDEEERAERRRDRDRVRKFPTER